MKRLLASLSRPRIKALPDLGELGRRLEADRLIVADVGSTGGPDDRWQECAPFTTFLTFDPDPRAEPASDGFRVINFPTGLWSSREMLPFFLTSFPPASTVMEPNHQVMDDYLNGPAAAVVGTESIALDTMVDTLAGQYQPDFIKVDTEGADLEILRGAAPFLASSCLGVQVEVSFVERNVAAPFFADTDSYLRARDFVLFDLVGYRFIRTSGVFGASSRPQLTCGDAIYFLDGRCFLERLRGKQPADRAGLFAKFITLLLVYGAHDYAAEIAIRTKTEGLVPDALADEALAVTKRAASIAAGQVGRLALGVLVSLGPLIVLFPFKGLRRRAGRHFRRRLRALVGSIAFWCSRDDPYAAVILGF